MAIMEQSRTGSGGFAGIDMANNDDVDVSFVFTTGRKTINITVMSSAVRKAQLGWL